MQRKESQFNWALGTVSAGMPENQSEFPYKTKLLSLGTARIQRKVLDT